MLIQIIQELECLLFYVIFQLTSHQQGQSEVRFNNSDCSTIKVLVSMLNKGVSALIWGLPANS